MATAFFEFGFQKNIQTVAGDFGSDGAAAEADDVGVIVLARQSGRQRVMNKGGTNVGVSVGGDGNADAAAADEHAALGLPSFMAPARA